MSIEELLEYAKGLPPNERRKLAERLLADIDEQDEAKPVDERLKALDRFLELAGTGHSDFADVSADKYQHLAAVYADEK
jgi:hypothetical protein